VYSTFWFEQVALTHSLDKIPVDNILFETDFPHVACLYENIRETIEAGLAGAPASVRERILRQNSAALYRIDDPTPADLTRMAQFAA
jgi:predicted TIM-barrel fold metal-dependent hydrolase